MTNEKMLELGERLSKAYEMLAEAQFIAPEGTDVQKGIEDIRESLLALAQVMYEHWRGYYWEAVEVCPDCEEENSYPFWNVEKQGYIATCVGCGRKHFLCDECYHSDDNPECRCDWEETPTGSKCFRGEIIL